jgi:DNA-binding response OmpR family regulator
MKLLIIDDNANIRRLYREEFEEEGYEVITAGSGKWALMLFEHERPDIVTLDTFMHDIDGKILLKKIKELSPQTPVIISSSYDCTNDFELWTSDACVLKSADLTELKGKIRDISEKVNERELGHIS